MRASSSRSRSQVFDFAFLRQLVLGDGQRFLHEANDVATEPAAVIAGDALDGIEILRRLRLDLRHFEDQIVAEDLERRPVGLARQTVAKIVERANDGQRTAVESAQTFEPAERLFVAIFFVEADLFQPAELFDRPLPSAKRRQLVAKPRRQER